VQIDLFEPGLAKIFTSANYQEFKKNLAQSGCSLCPELCEGRTNIVVDRGNPESKIVLIGEAPGENEDLEGKAFVGRAGQLLDKIMGSIGLDTNKDTLILNVVKCRPPANRSPKPQEAKNCLPYLHRQLEYVKPRFVVLLGATALKHLFPEMKEGGMKDRVGKFFDHPVYPGISFILLYHPAYLLRDPRKKADMWEHMKVLRGSLEKEGIIHHESAHR